MKQPEIEELPGFEELFQKTIEAMPIEKRLAGITPEQRLAGLAPGRGPGADPEAPPGLRPLRAPSPWLDPLDAERAGRGLSGLDGSPRLQPPGGYPTIETRSTRTLR